MLTESVWSASAVTITRPSPVGSGRQRRCRPGRLVSAVAPRSCGVAQCPLCRQRLQLRLLRGDFLQSREHCTLTVALRWKVTWRDPPSLLYHMNDCTAETPLSHTGARQGNPLRWQPLFGICGNRWCPSGVLVQSCVNDIAMALAIISPATVALRDEFATARIRLARGNNFALSPPPR